MQIFYFFFDIANIWGVDYDSSLDDDEIRSSIGVAVDWFTPVGPLNFSLAQPLSKSNNDKTESFRFNLGTTF
jgi:outer membrane protein insertion porin family